jgi:hypothetical protein
LFPNIIAQKDLQKTTLFPGFSMRKYLSVQHLRQCPQHDSGQKVIKIRKSFDRANSLPLHSLWEKNFQRSLVTPYSFLDAPVIRMA